MTYIYAFDHEHDISLDEMKRLVGGKGANLAVMTGRLGLPVPPASRSRRPHVAPT